MSNLENFIKENFLGNNEVKCFISERGNQRIEIKDLDTGEIWQTLEAVKPQDNMDNFEDISNAILSAIIQQIESEDRESEDRESDDARKEAWKMIGKYFGYPNCCIESFLKEKKINKKQLKVSNGTGFIPCSECVKKITRETLGTLINNRICPTAFPEVDEKHFDEFFKGQFEEN
jgi:hypothetical protein